MKQDVELNRRGGTVRLTLSAKVANDLDRLQEGLKSLAERLGHPQCATGCDILSIVTEREFAFRERLEPQVAVLAEHTRLAERVAPDVVSVTMPNEVNNSIDALQRAVAVTMDRLGCPACCSGFDILFRTELNTLALNENAEVVRFGGLLGR